MTRAEMIAQTDLLLGQAFGRELAADPFTASRMLDAAADRVCRESDCFYDAFTASLTADQEFYCAPLVYRIKDVYAVDAAGKTVELLGRTPAQMTALYGASWRDRTSDDPPQIVVFEGKTRVRLFPKPSETRADALVFEGYATTTSKVTGSTMHLWPGDDDECPVPSDGQMAVIFRACEMRCMPLVGEHPGAAEKMAMFMGQANRETGILFRDASKYHPQQRVGMNGRRTVFTI